MVLSAIESYALFYQVEITTCICQAQIYKNKVDTPDELLNYTYLPTVQPEVHKTYSLLLS